MGKRRRMITLDDVRTLDTEVPVETSDVPKGTTLSDEERDAGIMAIVELWPDDMPEEEFLAVVSRAMVSSVRSGKVGEESFVSPEAYTKFCERHGIKPIDQA